MNDPTVNYIWYGNWTGNTAMTILPNLITNLSGSSYANILSSYNLSNQFSYGTSYTVDSSSGSLWQGTSLDGTVGGTATNGVQKIIQSVLSAYNVPTSTNNIYYLLTSSDITVSGMYSSFCGWHSSTAAWGSYSLGTQYGFIGDPIQGDGCNLPIQDSPSINGNFGADAMASVIAHELFETITDPTGTGWYTGSYTEVADICNFTFGTTTNLGGAHYNVTANGANYLLQEQWVNTGGGTGYCTTSLPNSSPVPEPSSLAILGSGLLGLCLLFYRKRRCVTLASAGGCA